MGTADKDNDAGAGKEENKTEDKEPKPKGDNAESFYKFAESVSRGAKDKQTTTPICPTCGTSDYVVALKRGEAAGTLAGVGLGATAGYSTAATGGTSGAALGAVLAARYAPSRKGLAMLAGAAAGGIMGALTGAAAGSVIGNRIGSMLDKSFSRYRCNKCEKEFPG
jgi:ribosomal protein L37AE/L43A